DVTFDESVPFYRLFPYRSAPPPPPLLFLAPGPPPVDPLPAQGPAPLGVSQVDPLPGTAPVQVVVGSGAALSAASGGAVSGGAEPGGAESEGAETGGAEPGGVGTGGGEPGGAEPKGVEPGGAASEGAESGGAEPQCVASSGGCAGASPRLSPQQLRDWLVRRARLRSGATGAGGARGAGAAGAGGAGVATRAGFTRGTAPTGLGGARSWGTGTAGTGGVEGARAGDTREPRAAGAGGAGVGGPGAGGAGAAGAGAGGTGAAGAGAVDPGAGGAGGTPAYLLPAPSPYTEKSSGLTKRREHASRPVLPIRITRRAPRSRTPPVPGTHAMALSPSSVPQCVPLPAPLESTLPEAPDPESGRTFAASLAVSRLFATAVTDPSFESATASALVAELLDFAAACRLDYATALVAKSLSASPPSVGGPTRRSVLSTRQVGPVTSTQRRRTTLAALGFAPSIADPSLFLRTDTSLPPLYVLVYVDDLVFATADTKALTLLNSEL
ncbi:unnamed protein product, partial [Closterium sp. NIES-54]